jgi:hypothetical protein
MNACVIQGEVKISCKTMVDWGNFVREVATLYYAANPPTLGAHGDIIEMDETLLGTKRKYHCGNATRGMIIWIFGLVERRTHKFICMPVQSRDADTLIPIIQRHVVLGSTIHSDQWASYFGLTRLGYNHRTVNHSEDFVAANGVHTQTIEAAWSKLKDYVRHRSGLREETLQSHLDFYCFMKKARDEGEDPFEALIEMIKTMYPLP